MRTLSFFLLTLLATQAFSDDYGYNTDAEQSQPLNMAHIHMEHVYLSWSTAPDKLGFLTTASIEAKTAKQHMEAALQAPVSLAQIKQHSRQVAYALSGKGSGDALGYGVTKAAKGVKKHIMLAAQSPGSSDAIQMHALHIATSAQNVVMWSEQALTTAKAIERSQDLTTATELAGQLQQQVDHLVSGVDANNDGVASWTQSEGGLAQAAMHMDLLKAAEGL